MRALGLLGLLCVMVAACGSDLARDDESTTPIAAAAAGEPAGNAAAGNEQADASTPGGKLAGDVDYSCRSDDECAVKDVGNCCGYYPACVNRDSPTFPEQVKADCAASGAMSICGFREIDACVCRNERCEPAADSSMPVM